MEQSYFIFLICGNATDFPEIRKYCYADQEYLTQLPNGHSI